MSNMWARDTSVIVTTCLFHHFNKLLHCSLQLIVSIVFETLYASSDYGSAHPADLVC